eukprot:11649605-Karenia_brevis.AAC.1
MVESMKILGNMVTADATQAEDLENRFDNAMHAFYANYSQLCHKGVSIKKRLQLLQTLVAQ